MTGIRRDRSPFRDNYGEFAGRKTSVNGAGAEQRAGPEVSLRESPEITRINAPRVVDPNSRMAVEVTAAANQKPTIGQDLFWVVVKDSEGAELVESRSQNMGSGDLATWLVNVQAPRVGGGQTEYVVELRRNPARPGKVTPDTQSFRFTVNEPVPGSPDDPGGGGGEDSNGGDSDGDSSNDDNNNNNNNNNNNENRFSFSNLSTDQKILLGAAGLGAFALLGGGGRRGGGRRGSGRPRQ